MMLAAGLAEIGDLGQGTLASLILRKKGCSKGPAGSTTIYDDDFVHVLLWTGFHYKALVERSSQKLHAIWSQTSLLKDLLAATQQAGHAEATLADISAAVQETDDAFNKVINGVPQSDDEDDTPHGSESDKQPCWEPLKVNGALIRGARVYVGAGDPTNPRAPIKGDIYIDGVKLGEKLLEAAPNGHWRPRRKAKSVAKEILRAKLPCGLYARYSLNQERLLEAKVGQDAVGHAKKAGLIIDPGAVLALFKIG
jgi:hypothetical protein